MNGHIDRSARALVTLRVRPTASAQFATLSAWIDTAFTGELVVPRSTIERLQLPQSSVVTAGLADGNEVVLETFSCIVDWFGEERLVEVVESDAKFPLLGVGLFRDRRLEIDYRSRTLTIE